MFTPGTEPEGWVLGRLNSSWNKGKKSSVKYCYYTDGINEVRIKESDPIPEGYTRGFSDIRKQHIGETSVGRTAWNKGLTKETDSRVLYYTNNMIESLKHSEAKKNAYNPFRDKEWQAKMNEQYHKGCRRSDETRKRISAAKTGRRLSPEKARLKHIKYVNTMRQRGYYSPGYMTRPERQVFDILTSMYSQEDIQYQYLEDSRYPFNCDFYIKSIDVFVEVNAYYTHGKHPFRWQYNDENVASDVNAAHYDAWVLRDTKKLQVAQDNELNYLMLYADGLFYINKIPRELLETLSMKDNQQPSAIYCL